MAHDTKTKDRGRPNIIRRISVRAPASSYLTAMFVGSFFSALAFYLQLDLVGSILLAGAWIVCPALAMTDRIVFDGKRIYRSGIMPKGWAYLWGTRFWLKVRDIEQAETIAVPAVRRGGRVYFRYRTSVSGNGLEISFASGGRSYRRLARELFRSLPEEVLDAGSIELRDYIEEPGSARRQAKRSNIPPADVLEHAFRRFGSGHGRPTGHRPDDPEGVTGEKAARLRLLGNQLRLSGSLLQAMESFRRAASLRPEDPWLLFDFARCIQVFAGAERDPRLERKAAAMMRLAERRAGNDGHLLARLGESYSQLGEWRRAGNAFRKAVDAAGEQFRSIRGMAEIALRDGKLAHVVHNFSTASRLAASPAARRWSRAEADYFTRLNNDDEYMEMELGRVNLLDALDRWNGTTFRLCMLGFPFIGLGLYLEEPTIANCGWILAGSMLVIWTGIRLAARVFAPRIEPELLGEK